MITLMKISELSPNSRRHRGVRDKVLSRGRVVVVPVHAMLLHARTARYVIAAVACLALFGCGTISTKASGKGWGNPYSGTRSNVCDFTDGLSKGQRLDRMFLPILVVDVPLSFVADTVLLPVEIVLWSPSGCRTQMVPNNSLERQ